MDLSINPLSEGYKTYLESDYGLLEKNINKSQYRKEITDHMDESIRYLYQILQKSHMFKKELIYDKVNALSLYRIIESMLKDIDQKSNYKSEKYDFRTIELARMLFHVSTIYLIKSPFYQNEEIVKRHVADVAYHFRKLAENYIEKESFGTIKESEQRKLNEALNDIKLDPQSKYQKLNQEYNELVKEKEKTTNEDKIKELSAQIDEVLVKRKKEQKNVDKIEKEVNEKLAKKYDHLLNVFCPFERLSSFVGKINPHFPEEHTENKHIGV